MTIIECNLIIIVTSSSILNNLLEHRHRDALEYIRLLAIHAYLEQAAPILPHHHPLLMVQQVLGHTRVPKFLRGFSWGVPFQALAKDVGTLGLGFLDQVLADVAPVVPGGDVQGRVAARNLGVDGDPCLLDE